MARFAETSVVILSECEISEILRYAQNEVCYKIRAEQPEDDEEFLSCSCFGVHIPYEQ